MRKIIIFLIALFIQPHLYSQGQYLKKGQWGIGAGCGYSHSGDIGMTSVAFGVSIAGAVDIGASYAMPTNSSGEGMFSPNITVYPSKQDDNRKKLTVGISLSYTNANIVVKRTEGSFYGSSSSISYTTNERASIISLSFFGARKIKQNSISFIQLNFSPVISFVTQGGPSSLALIAGISLGIGNNRTPILVITPAVGYEIKSKLFIIGIETALIF